MVCPKCGYMMTDFDAECPRCARGRAEEERTEAGRQSRRRAAVAWVRSRTALDEEAAVGLLVAHAWDAEEAAWAHEHPAPPTGQAPGALLSTCPACSHDFALSATACPNCGHRRWSMRHPSRAGSAAYVVIAVGLLAFPLGYVAAREGVVFFGAVPALCGAAAVVLGIVAAGASGDVSNGLVGALAGAAMSVAGWSFFWFVVMLAYYTGHYSGLLGP